MGTIVSFPSSNSSADEGKKGSNRDGVESALAVVERIESERRLKVRILGA